MADVTLFSAPNHPYTQALLAEVPRVDTGKRQFKPIEPAPGRYVKAKA